MHHIGTVPTSELSDPNTDPNRRETHCTRLNIIDYFHVYYSLIRLFCEYISIVLTS